MMPLWIHSWSHLQKIGFFDSVDIFIEILYDPDQYRKKWYSYEEPYESEVMLRYRQDEESDEDREVDVGRDDFRIEIIRFDCMDDGDHDEYPEYCPESCESIRDDDDRNS